MPTIQPPADLAGYQHVVTGKVQRGDLLVAALREPRFVRPREIGLPIGAFSKYWGIYRKIPVARAGSAEGYPDPRDVRVKR